MILLAFDTRGAFKEFDQALAMLPDAESRAAVLRFKFEQDRQLALASQLLRRYVFVKYYGFKWDTLRFGSITKGGKPVLLHPQQSASTSSADMSYDFNISHHGHWVILAATDQPGHRVGVDIVTMDTPSSSVTEFIECFHPQASDK
ncbi:hypothetical protein LRAMOSA03759 [Lichtheimia ramosa]|uniref:holo-[acyl-carrier-protein] synthase n=1 Tax=Lichtheimia ramosa TaxID=688394 RepID=A0A077WV55_9FUNG|nr:hypothetical protein LRAMOSA03759 [Lichtheimia ramosa]